jgi:hypothetical protein
MRFPQSVEIDVGDGNAVIPDIATLRPVEADE